MHLSAGDLLREEIKSRSKDSELIDSYIKDGKIVPVAITCALLEKVRRHLTYQVLLAMLSVTVTEVFYGSSLKINHSIKGNNCKK